MMKPSLALATLCLLSACASTAPKPAASAAPAAAPEAKQAQAADIEAACKKPGFQCADQPIHIVLTKRDGSKYDQTLQPPVVIVQSGYVTIFAGQTLYLEADLDHDALTNLRVVPAATHPEKTLTLKFEQSEIAGQPAMTFSIQQPFDRPLKYRAGMMPLEGPEGLYKTSTCPVVAKGGGFETWPQPLFQLVLADFHLVATDSKEAGVCD